MNLKLQLPRATMLAMLFMGTALVTNAQKARPKLPKKAIAQQKKTQQATAEDKFVAELLSKMTLDEKVGQLSQYVGGSLLTGPKSGALSDSLMARGMVGSI